MQVNTKIYNYVHLIILAEMNTLTQITAKKEKGGLHDSVAVNKGKKTQR